MPGFFRFILWLDVSILFDWIEKTKKSELNIFLKAKCLVRFDVKKFPKDGVLVCGESKIFYFCRRVSPVRPAPAESPQGRKAARVSGCSGATQVAYPLFVKSCRISSVGQST